MTDEIILTEEEILIEEVFEESEEITEDPYTSLLTSIDEKLGLLLEQEAAFNEAYFLLESEKEAIDYSDLLTNLDTNMSQYTLLYEEELARTAKEEPPVEKDYTEMLLSVDQKLDTFTTIVDSVESAANSVVTYSVLYIPLGVIIISLYWFFSQFMNRYY